MCFSDPIRKMCRGQLNISDFIANIISYMLEQKKNNLKNQINFQALTMDEFILDFMIEFILEI